MGAERGRADARCLFTFISIFPHWLNKKVDKVMTNAFLDALASLDFKL